MVKVLLISVLVAVVAIPAWAARLRNPRQALRWLLVGMVGFNVSYLLALRFLYHRLL